MKKHEFLTSIEAAGFELDNNRVTIENDMGVNLKTVLEAQGFQNKTAGRFDEYSRNEDNFTINMKSSDPVFATVDLI